MMVRLLKQLIDSEKGQALPVVLALLVLGGLTVASSLGYGTTSLSSSRKLEENVKGIYAADAGVEDTLWSLSHGIPPSPQLMENINEMPVAIQTEDFGNFTLYLGEFIEPAGHFDYLDVDGDIVWDAGTQTYNYTVTVTWQAIPGDPVIHLDQLGARLPMGYSYVAGSAATFPGNMSTDEPNETLDSVGLYLINWVFGPPLPQVTDNATVQTQTFSINGTGELEGNYTWVVANRSDVGAVGEITGTKYEITATANSSADGKTTAKIMADVMVTEQMIYVTSWQILN
jgi:hypothetical protein